jgi:hypothetical protein
MMAEMKKSTLIIDDISHHEIEKLIEIYKPDIIGSGIKDKFVIEKMGVPCKQLHSYDYSGPYAAFTGAANFYREVDRMVNTKIWKFVTPPWENEPQLTASLVHPSRVSGSQRRRTAKPKAPGADRRPPWKPTVRAEPPNVQQLFNGKLFLCSTEPLLKSNRARRCGSTRPKPASPSARCMPRWAFTAACRTATARRAVAPTIAAI